MNDNVLTWGSFIKAKGWEGLNNAAINTFNSDVVNSFVREIFQNSNDAREENEDGTRKKLEIEINYGFIDAEKLPGYNRLLSLIRKISSEPANASHEPFFSHAIESLRNERQIRIFEYKDFNTTGLSGTDDDPNSTFNACVLSEGTSIKQDETAGGSYGIGKNSIYGFSKVRTILYSSLNLAGEVIFQGVSKLASYKEAGKTYESRIYFGKGELLSSIRDLNELPESTRNLVTRERPGLTQITICPIEQENWIEEFTKSILRNYWPLICTGDLRVVLKENKESRLTIENKNLEILLNQYFSPDRYEPDEALPSGNPLDYYNCFKNTNPKQQEIYSIGNVKFYFTELSHKKTNSVVFIRNGMVIHAEQIWGFGSIGYCGVLICESAEGNKLLRMMEPPTHDKFDPARLNDKSKRFDESDGKKILKQIKKMIRESLGEILSKYRKQAEEIPWLNELIKSLKGFQGNGRGSRANEQQQQESIHRISSNKKFELDFKSVDKNAVITFGEDGTDASSGPRGTILAGPKVKPAQKLSPGSLPGTKKNKLRVNSRIFKIKQNEDGSAEYKIILTSEKESAKIDFRLSQVGDSGNAASFDILNITDQSGNRIEFKGIFNAQGELTAYRLFSMQLPSQLSLKIKEPYKSTFKIIQI